jgi:hypothetical protein
MNKQNNDIIISLSQIIAKCFDDYSSNKNKCAIEFDGFLDNNESLTYKQLYESIEKVYVSNYYLFKII